MHFKGSAICILLSLMVIVASVSQTSVCSSSVFVSKVTLYAHYDESFPALNNRTLTTDTMWGDYRTANASEGVEFTLYRSLGSDLSLKGTVLFKAWLKADADVLGRLFFALYEVNSAGESIEVVKVEGFVGLTNRPDQKTFGLSGVEHLFKKDSTIQFRVLFISDRPRITSYLLWNTESRATQIELPCVNHIDVIISAYNSVSPLMNFFSLNRTIGFMNISFIANVTDPFGVQDLKKATLTIINGRGGLEVADEPMSLIRVGAALYTAVYGFNKTLREGVYNAGVNITDLAGNTLLFKKDFWIARFYSTTIRFLDGEGLTLTDINYTLSNINTGLGFEGKTNNTGYSTVTIPPSSLIGDYNITASYGNSTYSSIVEFSEDGEVIDLRLPLYNVEVRASFYMIPLPKAAVKLVGANSLKFEGETAWNGTVVFRRVPEEKYQVSVDYAGGVGEKMVDVKERVVVPVHVESMYLIIGGLAFISLVSTSSAIAILKRRKGFAKKDFSFIDKLIEGGVPLKATIMITGPPASGKSSLLGSVANQSLRNGRKCVYIVNTDFPENVKDQLASIGIDVKKFEEEGKIAFVDCYSGISGRESKEPHHVDSPNDVTRIGMEISLCLEEMGDDIDIYYDSLSTILTSLKIEQLISFIQATGAKVKGVGGRFCFTIGSEAKPEEQARIEESIDCVFELRIKESDHRQMKMLRVKKIRGKWHLDSWINFDVKGKKGIVFLVRRGVL